MQNQQNQDMGGAQPVVTVQEKQNQEVVVGVI